MLRLRSFITSLTRDYPLLRILVADRWFRAAMVLILAIVVGVPLVVIKAIPVTPPGVMPEVQISGLDWLQSTAFARRARRLSSGSDTSDHAQAWRLAIGNNPGNLEYNRAYLGALIQYDIGRIYWNDAIRTGLWLLKLSAANRMDLELSCLAFEHYYLDDLSLSTIEANPKERSAVLDQIYLRALFANRDVKKFLTVWDIVSEATRQEPTLKLYRVAIDTTLDQSGAIEKGQAAIDQAKSDVKTESLGHRLQLFVSHHHRDLDTFRESFGILEDNFHASVSDHLLYWDLLWITNHRELAQTEALSFARPPKTARDVVAIANAYSQLGLSDLAFQYLKNYALDYGFSTTSTSAQARILIDGKKWDELWSLAIGMRATPGISNEFMGFSYYLEGKANFELKRRSEALSAFQKIREFSLLESDLGLYVGSNLKDLGYPEEAMTVLWPERNRYRNDLAFWELAREVSAELREGTRLLISVENLYRIEPDNIVHAANYAAILISQRIQVEKALSLTYNAVLHYPDNASIQINYGHALVLNQRYSEAEKILGTIDVRPLNTSTRQGYFLAQLELNSQEGNIEKLEQFASAIIPSLLLPGDRKIYEAIVEEFEIALTH